MVNGPDSKPWLEKLAQDKGIQIPMVYLAKGPKDLGVRLYKINPQAKNTFLVDDKRQVVTNLVNVDDFPAGCRRFRENVGWRWIRGLRVADNETNFASGFGLRSFRFALAAFALLLIRSPAVRTVSPPADSEMKVVQPEDVHALIAANKGKVVFLNFFATYCVPCHTEFPDIIKMAKKYQNAGLQVVEISMNDSILIKGQCSSGSVRRTRLSRLHRVLAEDDFYKGVRRALGDGAADDHDFRPGRQEGPLLQGSQDVRPDGEGRDSAPRR